MEKKENIVRYSARQIKEKISRGESKTDWARVDALTDEEIAAATASDPAWEGIPENWYEYAVPYYPKEAKRQVTLRLDPDVLSWFRKEGRGYQTRINAALRAYVEAHRGQHSNDTPDAKA